MVFVKQAEKTRALVVGFLLAGLMIAAVPAASAELPDKAPAPRGQAAIARLGNFLPAVAQNCGMTAAGLRVLFLSDSSLSVDSRG